MHKLARYAAPLLLACTSAPEPARRIVFDFEDGESWRVEMGDLWGAPAARPTRVHRHGKHFMSTGESEDGFDIERRGRMRSPSFEIDHDYLVLRVGGHGTGKRCNVQLRRAEGEKQVHKITTTGVPKMTTHILDVRALRGEQAFLRLADRSQDKPCAVHIDYVRLVDG